MTGQLSFLPETTSLTRYEEFLQTLDTQRRKDTFLHNNKIDYQYLYEQVDKLNKQGIKINTELLDNHIKQAEERTARTLREWKAQLDYLNLDYIHPTPALVSELFFIKLGLPVIKTTKGGAPALDKKALTALAEFTPLAPIYRDFKSAGKMVKMLQNIKKAMVGGRVYPQLHVNGAASGRFTCDGVNIQQFPEWIRDIVVPDEGTLVYIDYSQIEYRVQATLANDTDAIERFRAGEDAHDQLAELLNTTRDKAKTINYAISFGMTSFGLAIELGVSEAEAQHIIDEYWASKPHVAKKKSEIIGWAKRNGFAPTIYGFSREISQLAKDDQIWSTAVQGSAADLMKLCMVNMFKYLETSQAGKILANVHDALLIEVVNMDALKYIERIFTNVDDRFVLACESKIGHF